MSKKPVGSAGNVRPGGKAAKREPLDNRKTPDYPETPLPPEMLDVVSRWLSRKSEPEIRQAINALTVMAQEHRMAGREEQARMAEVHIPIMRSYLAKVLPMRKGVTVQ